jgi:ribonuclease-3
VKTEALERELGHQFIHRELLNQALTHRSHSADHNERLEFLGDSILNMVIAEALYLQFDGLREGEMSRLRAQLVCQDALVVHAERLDIGGFLRLGEGELRSGGHAMEALFGAIYLDAGFAAAKGAIDGLYAQTLADLDPKHSLKDPKTALQEAVQALHLPLPRYEMAAERGEAHAREFEVRCVIDKLGIQTTGVGNSRRVAEQVAAGAALQEMAKA